MKFNVIYRVGTSEREKHIIADNLDEAEIICNEKFKNWIDIIMIDKTKEKLIMCKDCRNNCDCHLPKIFQGTDERISKTIHYPNC